MEAMETEEVFFVMIALSFVSTTFTCGKEGGICVEERETGMEEETCVEANGPVWRSMGG